MVDSDEVLVERHLGGQREAFRVLVERHTPAVFNLAYRLTGDRDEAADITQETFRRVVEALPASRRDLPFKPWLLQIAVNLCRDWAKRKRPASLDSLSLPRNGQPDDANLVDTLPDIAPLPADRLEADETAQALRRAVADLPDAYRAAITLRYVEDLSYQEIAATLGLPLNTVRTHLARAKKLLHARLQGEMER